MSTSPVTSVTDELLAELEAIHEDASQFATGPDDQEYLGVLASRALTELRRLRAENAELAKDAGRYRWLRDHYHGFSHYRAIKHNKNAMRDEIDTAMAAQ